MGDVVGVGGVTHAGAPFSLPTRASRFSVTSSFQGQMLIGKHVAGQIDDLHLSAHGVGAGFQGPIHLLGGVQDGGLIVAAAEGLDADIGGDYVDQVAALGDDGMDPDRVLYPGKFPAAR